MADGWDDGDEPYRPWNQGKFAKGLYSYRLRWYERKRIYEAEQRGDNSVGEKMLNDIAERDAQRGGCFVATAVYQDSDAPEVNNYRWLKDNVLEGTYGGRMFNRGYYNGLGTALASVVEALPFLRRPTRAILDFGSRGIDSLRKKRA